MYRLDDRLANDTRHVGQLPLCEVLLMDDSQFPWVILVPRCENVVEILDLSTEEQSQLWQESRLVSLALRELFSPDKLNIAALGNVVSQLHVHHIVRYTSDVAWPAPVWGRQPATKQKFSASVSLKNWDYNRS